MARECPVCQAGCAEATAHLPGRCRGGGTQVPVALGVWMQPLCWEQELARTFQLVLALSHGAFNLPFDLTTSSPGADFFE